jgi:hypothetical protein
MSTTLPSYFESDFEGGMYYHQGDRVYGTITQKGTNIEYVFNDGSKSYRETLDMGTEAKAIKAASKMAAEMRRYAPSIPHMGTFRILFE